MYEQGGILPEQIYRTMTVGGLYGTAYYADSWEEAEAMATRDGYVVLDYSSDGETQILVVK